MPSPDPLGCNRVAIPIGTNMAVANTRPPIRTLIATTRRGFVVRWITPLGAVRFCVDVGGEFGASKVNGLA